MGVLCVEYWTLGLGDTAATRFAPRESRATGLARGFCLARDVMRAVSALARSARGVAVGRERERARCALAWRHEAAHPRRRRRRERALCARAARECVDATSVNAVERAAAALRAGGVIAVPTDTIYGFAACAKDGAAVRRLYEIKGRRATAAVAIAVGDVEDIATYGECGHLRAGLLGRILPGPVTVLLRRRVGAEGASPELNPGVELIGIRVPASDFVRNVCRAHGGAIALTSANRSGETSTTSVEEFEPLWDACAEVFDGGRIETKRLGSTIVDLSSLDGQFGIVREGERCAELVALLETEFSLKRR